MTDEEPAPQVETEVQPPALLVNGGISTNKLSVDKDPKGMAIDFPITITRIGITVASTVLTWYAQRQYTSVMASAAVTLACSMCFDRRLGQAAFCGSFAGMGSSILIPSWKYAFALGGATSLLFEALIHYKNLYLGIGGRLGATAFVASSILAYAQEIPTGVALASVSTIETVSKTLSKNKDLILAMALWHAIGSVATIALREASDESAASDPVRASAVIGLIAALFLQNKGAALAVYGGSFVGMSLPSRLMNGILPNKKVENEVEPVPPNVLSLFSSFAVAGALGGAVHGASIALGWWPGAWGGKAGFCSFLGCLAYRGMAKTTSVFTRGMAKTASIFTRSSSDTTVGEAVAEDGIKAEPES